MKKPAWRKGDGAAVIAPEPQIIETLDVVNHPKHYCSHPAQIECIEVIEHFPLNIGNAVKYLWRCGLKEGNDPITDLKKAIWFINREIERKEKYGVK